MTRVGKQGVCFLEGSREEEPTHTLRHRDGRVERGACAVGAVSWCSTCLRVSLRDCVALRSQSCVSKRAEGISRPTPHPQGKHPTPCGKHPVWKTPRVELSAEQAMFVCGVRRPTPVARAREVPGPVGFPCSSVAPCWYLGTS